jgi:uncharacterized protein (TIGR03435 family)
MICDVRHVGPRRHAPLLVLAIATAVAVSASARQSPPADRSSTEFEVASIKPNLSGSGRSGSSMPPRGIFRGTNLTLRQLIVTAYRVRTFQVVAGPDWIDNDRFDLQARASDDAMPDQMPVMLQALLAERFGLAFHREVREQPVYALVMANDNGALGPALKRSECPDGCGLNTSTTNGSGTALGKGETMGRVAEWLGNMVDRMVIDRTGLAGTFDFELRFTRDDALGRSDLPPDAPSIFTALREQLGLRLESARGPVEFLVIDRASQPTPD